MKPTPVPNTELTEPNQNWSAVWLFWEGEKKKALCNTENNMVLIHICYAIFRSQIALALAGTHTLLTGNRH